MLVYVGLCELAGLEDCGVQDGRSEDDIVAWEMYRLNVFEGLCLGGTKSQVNVLVETAIGHETLFYCKLRDEDTVRLHVLLVTSPGFTTRFDTQNQTALKNRVGYLSSTFVYPAQHHVHTAKPLHRNPTSKHHPRVSARAYSKPQAPQENPAQCRTSSHQRPPRLVPPVP